MDGFGKVKYQAKPSYKKLFKGLKPLKSYSKGKTKDYST